ncbi:geranylgeranyl transferase type-2 subunit beta [Apiospora rasikravindrae]|uniref:Geranylgeranyl transferase type-2 subunit alpha n=1 Tax=Apiospora rasikravindrae TaxID=990691 RepID=A0ABR1T0C1_9PEZI
MATHGIARTNRSRTEEQRQQDLDKIQKYRDLDDQIQSHVKQSNYSDPALFQLTTKILRLNPEYYTIWNVRRRCLISGLLSKRSAGLWRSKASPSTSRSVTTKPSCAASSPSPSAATPADPATSPSPKKDGESGTTPEQGEENTDPKEKEENDEKADIAADTSIVQAELAFTIPLLIEFPKCYWIWGYRSFLLSLCDAMLPAGAARDFWVAELALDSKMLTKDRRNFHAWSYRRFIVSALESTAKPDGDDGSGDGSTATTKSMTESEFAYTYSMIKVDLSNFSAWHNRSKLALRLLDERGADDASRKKFLEEELELVREGLNVGPEDQSLWYYHQFLMDHITAVGAHAGAGEDKETKDLIAPNLSLADRREFVDREVTEIKDLLEDYDDVKLIYEALLEYAMAYRAMGVSDGDTANQDEMMAWLAKLRELDPLRRGRWDDLEKSLKAR